MKGHKITFVGKPGEQSCQVAVADEDFGMGCDLGQIDRLQKIVRAVASARADDRTDIVAHKHLFEFPHAAFGRACEIQIAIEDRVEIKGLIAQAAKAVAACLQEFALDVGRGRNDADLVAAPEGRRLDS